MISLTFIVLFIFCLAIAVASLLIGHKFTNTYNAEFHRNYFYYLITFFAFAFYGILSQILIHTLLPFIDSDKKIIGTIVNFLPILSTPFLIVSWVMLIKMGYSLTEIKTKRIEVQIHLGILALFLFLIGCLYFLWDTDTKILPQRLIYGEIGLMTVIELSYMFFFARTIVRYSKKGNTPKKKIAKKFMALMVLGSFIRGFVLLFMFIDSWPWLLIPLVLLYFLTNFGPLLYLYRTADIAFVPVYAKHPSDEKKTLLFEKYQITKREKEIIEQMCQGKTNQQIADTLFISLQTVKDHTHRIYTKIGISSRLKLVQMINGRP
ncbi:helix-turn-helix transcriptional regulator [uncultured Kriegella sp.]|uniref:helix-turn-helix transcriptional regulator n=1 Tax=uncultured Kriegella sp. TaxID=1798910 RepID=UPI0030DAA1D8